MKFVILKVPETVSNCLLHCLSTGWFHMAEKGNCRRGNYESLGKVNAVLTGKAVSFAHGSKSAIDKKVVGGRQSVSFLGLMGDEQGDLRFHGGVEKALTFTPLSTTVNG